MTYRLRMLGSSVAHAIVRVPELDGMVVAASSKHYTPHIWLRRWQVSGSIHSPHLCKVRLCATPTNYGGAVYETR